MGGGSKFSDFKEIARSGSFLLCKGSYAICKEVVGEIERQNVTYNLLRQEFAQPKEIFVEIKDCQIICTSATGIFD